MIFTFLRGACCIVESGDAKILCDPWLDDGVYYGAWAHYPPFKWDYDFSDLTHIYVSHIHPDHFSAATMKRLPKVPVLIHKFQSPFLRANIAALGFQVIEIEHAKSFDLGGMTITIYAADDCNPVVCGRFFGCSTSAIQNTQIDSLCVLQDKHHTLVNVNDCPYGLSKHMLPKLRAIYPKIDLMLVAYAGAGPYPQCFDMTDAEKNRKAAIKKRGFIEHATKFALDLNARLTFPFAGDYVLAGKLAPLNPYRGVATLVETHDDMNWAGVKTLKLNGGESWEIDSTLPTLNRIDERAKQHYIDSVLGPRKLDYESDSAPDEDDLRYLLNQAATRLEGKRQQLGFTSRTTLCIDTQDGFAWIPFSGGKLEYHSHPPSQNYTRLTVDPRLLYRILQGPRYAHWNNAEIGSHIMFKREPDVFERGVSQLVSFLHA